MTELYLITGFLGAGKSTFLKNFMHLFDGRKMQLIINEFGKEGIDGALLAALGIGLEEITGGSVFCSCRLDQFEKAMTTFVQPDTEVLLVEASGLTDPTGVKKLFGPDSRYTNIDYKGAVCLVDAVRFPKVYAKSRTVVKQIAASDVILINKTDIASAEELSRTTDLIRNQRPDAVVLETSFGRVDAGILKTIADAYTQDDSLMNTAPDISIRSLTVTVSPNITSYQLQKFIEMFVEQTFRVKGFIQTAEGMMLADCVGNIVSIKPYELPVDPEKAGKLTVLSGAGMPVVKHVKNAVLWYPDEILSVDY